MYRSMHPYGRLFHGFLNFDWEQLANRTGRSALKSARLPRLKVKSHRKFQLINKSSLRPVEGPGVLILNGVFNLKIILVIRSFHCTSKGRKNRSTLLLSRVNQGACLWAGNMNGSSASANITVVAFLSERPPGIGQSLFTFFPHNICSSLSDEADKIKLKVLNIERA